MSGLKSAVTSLETKLEKLVDLHRKTRKEVQALQLQNEQLSEALAQQKQTIKDLEDQSKVLRISKTITNNKENTTELKLKINELIREVDKCIALLNK